MKTMTKTKLAMAISLSLYSLVGFAEETSQSEEKDIEKIIVTGVRGSLANSMNLKRESSGISDSISAEDMGDFPDLNISESLQRITGVAIERNLGEGTQVSVRGLRPEFTQILINGQTVTSGGDGREVEFDVFASELFSSVEVAKSHNASQIEGGLAATINMRTARALELTGASDNGTVFSLTAQAAQNEIADELSPRISGLAAVELMDGKLGLLGSIAYSETHLRQDNVEGLRFKSITADVNGSPENVEYPFIPRYLVEFKDRDRLGVTGAIQYDASETLNINLDVAYAQFDEVRTRHSIDGGLFSGSYITAPAEPLVVDSTGLVTELTADGVTSRSENIKANSTEDLILVNLDGTWDVAENWLLTGRLGYSKSTKDEGEFRSTWNNNGTFSYDMTDRIFLGLSQVGQDITDAVNFDDRHEARFIDTDIEDEITSLQVDAERYIENSLISSLAFGFRVNEREKGKKLADGRERVTGVSLADYDTSFPVSDFFSQHSDAQIIRSWAVSDFDAVLSDTTLVSAGFTPPPKLISTFVVNEQSFSNYLQANIDGELGDVPVRGHFGARLVNTEQTSSGFTSDGTPVFETSNYTEVLPSAALTFELSDDLIMRTAIGKSLTRPTITKLTPGGTIANGVNDASFGNPKLDPYTASNYDLSLEWYFAEEALMSVALFHKDVTGFITNVSSDEVLGVDVLGADDPRAGEIFSVNRPVNGDDAYVQGYEVAIQTPLSGALENFGVMANYTFSDSESTITFGGKQITTLLPGQSKSSYNLVGYYEVDEYSVRFAYAWRDSFLDEIRSSNTERSNYIKEYGQLDMSVQYHLNENVTFTFDALNILEEEQIRYGESEDRNIRFSETGRFFMLGARMKF